MIRTGRHRQVIAPLITHTAAYPANGMLWQLLIVALYADHRDGDASQALRGACTASGRQGLDPGSFQQLHQQLLRHELPRHGSHALDLLGFTTQPAPDPAEAAQPADLTRLLIGADGANSVVRRAFGAPRSAPGHTGIAMRAYARSDDFNPGGPQGPRMLFSFGRELLPSYAWLFPTGRGIVNIGAGGPLTEIQRTNRDLHQLVATYTGQVRAQGTGISEPCDHRAHHLPHFGSMPRLTYPRGVLIGDAASMINPFSGEGIAYGMTAAARLVESLPGDLTSGPALQDALARFERGFRSTYRTHIASTLVLHRLMRKPYWARLFISAAGQDPTVLRDAIELLFGSGRARVLTASRILRTRWH